MNLTSVKTKFFIFDIRCVKTAVLVLIQDFRKFVSEVGFEPTPTFVDQNTPVRKSSTLESGALDRSAILTMRLIEKIEFLLARNFISVSSPWKPLYLSIFVLISRILRPGELAQMVERSIRIREARGSIPRFSTPIYFFLQKKVENRPQAGSISSHFLSS